MVLVSSGRHWQAIAVKVGEDFLPYLHASVANAAPEAVALQDAPIDIGGGIVENDASVGDAAIMALGEGLAEHEGEVRAVLLPIQISDTCILLLRRFLPSSEDTLGDGWHAVVLLLDQLGLLVRR